MINLTVEQISELDDMYKKIRLLLPSQHPRTRMQMYRADQRDRQVVDADRCSILEVLTFLKSIKCGRATQSLSDSAQNLLSQYIRPESCLRKVILNAVRQQLQDDIRISSPRL